MSGKFHPIMEIMKIKLLFKFKKKKKSSNNPIQTIQSVPFSPSFCPIHRTGSAFLSTPPLPRCAVSSGCEQNNVNVWRHLTSLLAFRAQPNHSRPEPIGN